MAQALKKRGLCNKINGYPASLAGTDPGKTVSSLKIAGSQSPSDGLTNAPMVAAVNGVEPESSVTLEFYPAFTAFEVTLKSKDQEITLKKVTLISTSTALSGSYSATIAPNGGTVYNCPALSSTNGKVEYTFGSNTKITTDQSATFTILALPQQLKDMTIDFEGDGKTVSIRGTVAENTMIISRINDYNRVYFVPRGNAFIVEHDDAPGMLNKITGACAEVGINIEDIHASRSDDGKRMIAILMTDKLVGKETVAKVVKMVNAKNAFAFTL